MAITVSWRKHRRAANEAFNPKVVEKFRPIHTRAAIEEVIRILDNPESWEECVDRYGLLNTTQPMANYSLEVQIPGLLAPVF